MSPRWCSVCRGDGTADELHRCGGCQRRYHIECLGLRTAPPKEWRCEECVEHEGESLTEDEAHRRAAFARRQKKLVEEHRRQQKAKRVMLVRKQELLKPFVAEAKLEALRREHERDKRNHPPEPPGGAAADDGGGRPCDTTQPSYITATLRDYQVEGVNWMVAGFDSGIGGILGDQMGLGKTLQTLTFLSYLKKMRGAVGPSLVVAPLAVYQNWANECKAFTPELSFFKLHGSAQERAQLFSRMDVVYAEYDVFITTYDTLKNSETFFTETIPRWQCLVVDEGHNLKNESSGLTKSLSRLKANYRLLLTGTPLQNNMHELWVLLTSLLPDYFTSSESFDISFDLNKQAFDSSLVLMARSLLQFFMLRRLKSDVVALPPKVEATVYCPVTSLQAKWYARVLRRDKHSASILSASQLLTTITQLRKVCNHPKILLSQQASKRRRDTSARAERLAQAVKDELEGLSSEALVEASGKMLILDRLLARLKAQGSRVLLFSTFTQTLDVMQEFLAYRGYAYLRMDGSTNKIKRELDLRDFNAPGSEYFVYLISTRAGGVGINLATADAVVLYDSDWNPQIDLQAIDRAHRIGQKKPVRIFRLITQRSVEERILQRARQKIQLDSAVMNIAAPQGEAEEEAAAGAPQLEKTLRRDELMEILGVREKPGEAKGVRTKVRSKEGSTSEAAVERIVALAFKESSGEAGEEAAAAGEKEGEAEEEEESEEEESASEEESSEEEGEEGEAEAAGGAMEVEAEEKEEEEEEKKEGVEEGSPACERTPSEEAGGGGGPPFKRPRGQAPRDMHGHAKLWDEKVGVWRLHDEVRQELLALEQANERRTDLIKEEEEAKKRQEHFQVHSGLSRNSRRREQANRFEPRFDDGPDRKKKPVLRHEDFCFLCTDGGELLECGACCKVYHIECLGLSKVPKGIWFCPWHSCCECDRKVSTAGGMLFRCSDCPTAYCFDCWPTGLQRLEPDKAYLEPLLRRGYDPTKNAALFVCHNCADEKLKERREQEEAERQRQERALEKERARREAHERLVRQQLEAAEKQRQRDEKLQLAEARRLEEERRRQQMAEAQWLERERMAALKQQQESIEQIRSIGSTAARNLALEHAAEMERVRRVHMENLNMLQRKLNETKVNQAAEIQALKKRQAHAAAELKAYVDHQCHILVAQRQQMPQYQWQHLQALHAAQASTPLAATPLAESFPSAAAPPEAPADSSPPSAAPPAAEEGDAPHYPLPVMMPAAGRSCSFPQAVSYWCSPPHADAARACLLPAAPSSSSHPTPTPTPTSTSTPTPTPTSIPPTAAAAPSPSAAAEGGPLHRSTLLAGATTLPEAAQRALAQATARPAAAPPGERKPEVASAGHAPVPVPADATAALARAREKYGIKPAARAAPAAAPAAAEMAAAVAAALPVAAEARAAAPAEEGQPAEPSAKKAQVCSVCNKALVSINVCGACKTQKYCSRECQLSHWPTHLHVCAGVQRS